MAEVEHYMKRMLLPDADGGPALAPLLFVLGFAPLEVVPARGEVGKVLAAHRGPGVEDRRGAEDLGVAERVRFVSSVDDVLAVVDGLDQIRLAPRLPPLRVEGASDDEVEPGQEGVDIIGPQAVPVELDVEPRVDLVQVTCGQYRLLHAQVGDRTAQPVEVGQAEPVEVNGEPLIAVSATLR